jgi:hypothetical protein
MLTIYTLGSDVSAVSALAHVRKMQTVPVAGFTPGERDYIRRELVMFFSIFPTVAEGFSLSTWRSGPQAGKPKLPSAARRFWREG